MLTLIASAVVFIVVVRVLGVLGMPLSITLSLAVVSSLVLAPFVYAFLSTSSGWIMGLGALSIGFLLGVSVGKAHLPGSGFHHLPPRKWW